jgi:hypothetical protein
MFQETFGTCLLRSLENLLQSSFPKDGKNLGNLERYGIIFVHFVIQSILRQKLFYFISFCQVPTILIEFFLSLGAHASNKQVFKMDSDRAILCAFNFPAVALTAGVDLWDSHLKDTYLTLTKDYQIKVRRTFAYSLHEIARIIGPERTEHDLVQIFALYLMDLDEVKQGVLEHLSDFLAALAPSSRDEYIPILAEVWDGVMTNWRLRDTLAGQLKDISLLFDPTHVVEHVVPLALRACQDEFASVRDTGVSCVSKH